VASAGYDNRIGYLKRIELPGACRQVFVCAR